MTAQLSLPDVFPGLHRVKSRSKRTGLLTVYWYLWRGGPRIAVIGPVSADGLGQAESAALPEAIEAARPHLSKAGDNVTLHGAVTRFLVALEAMPGAPRTKKDLRKHLDILREEEGQLELRALESKRARPYLIKWRDKRKATPKTADDLFGAARKVLDWLVDQGELSVNPIKDVAGLYTAPDRSAIIWRQEAFDTLFRHADQPFIDAVEFMALSGVRLGDARRLPRSARGADAIVFQTGKSNSRRTAVVPITDELRVVLDRLPVSPKSTTLLNSSRQTPWSEPGLESAIQRARKAALAEVQARHGPKAESGIEGLRLHDLRGTAATHYIRAGLEDGDIATILGWSSQKVAEIRRRYVSGQEIGLAIIRRMKANKASRNG